MSTWKTTAGDATLGLVIIVVMFAALTAPLWLCLIKEGCTLIMTMTPS